MVLHDFYNKKYASETEVKPVRINGYPRDRFEAAVYWGKGSGRALEIGAGSGNIALCLKDHYEEYIATELSTIRIKYLNDIFKKDPRIKVINNDIEEKNLNFPQGYFDTIIMIAVVEHLLEPISALGYCYSLLKPGGRLLVNTPNIAKWTRRLKLLFGFFPSTASRSEGLLTYNKGLTALHDEGHLHYFTFRSLKRILMDRIRFAEVKYCGYGTNLLPRILPTLFSECCVIAVKK